jgi:hypothetical protein
MQFFVPSDKAAPLSRPGMFGPGTSLAIVNQSDEDVYMSDTPAELDASASGLPAIGGIRIANGGGEVLWPASIKVAWFRAIIPWQPGTVYAAGTIGASIIDKFGNIWAVSTIGTTGAAYPFPATEPAIGATQADNTVVWTFEGPCNTALNIMPG